MRKTNDIPILLSRAAKGDLKAFNSIVERFQDLAVGYAYSILRELTLAEDAAQEAFLQLFMDLKKLKAPQAFTKWFKLMIYKQCDRIRRKARIQTLPIDAAAGVASGEVSLSVGLERKLMVASIDAVLSRIPESERSVLVLFHMHGSSLMDISKFLGLPLTTVDHRLRSARRHFSKRMVEAMHDELQERAPSQSPRFVAKVMDLLTQAANMNGFARQLSEKVKIGFDDKGNLGVALLDIDDFDAFNSRWGHVAGDCLLSALAKQVKDQLHPNDFMGRTGGEEFAIALFRSSREQLIDFADSVRSSIADAKLQMKELLLPNARNADLDPGRPASVADEDYSNGLRLLGAKDREGARAAFESALEKDSDHVPSIMELEYLKLLDSPSKSDLAAVQRVTVSGGLSCYQDGDTSESMLRRASELMSKAKEAGKNRIIADG